MFELTGILVNLLIFAGIFLLIFALFRFPVPAEPPVHRRLAVALGAGQRSTIFEQPQMAPIMSLALTMARRFTFQMVRDRIRRDLDAAGNPNGYSVEEYLAICLLCAAILAVAAALMMLLLFGWIEPFTVLLMSLVGFGAPMWAARREARQRMMRISKQLPYSLDLIALTMGAGSTFTEAVEAIIRDRPEEDFNQELRLVQAEIGFGSSRAAALANMAERIPLDSLRSIVGAVNQAETLGTPLATILTNQASMLRMHRSVRAEKLSASASLQILVPSMLILIAVVLTVFGPMIIHWYITGSPMGS